MDVYADLDALSHAGAELVVDQANRSADEHGNCALVLAGGSTPRRLYELLATEYRKEIPWSKMRIFWGDERFVPHDDPDSNYRMAQEALLKHVPLSSSQVHPMPADGDPAMAAGRYDDILDAFAKQRPGAPLFDIVLLGLGEDGHTASIFPETMGELTDPSRKAIAVKAPPRHTPRQRLSLTLNALNNSEEVIFLVAGSSKREALRQTSSLKNSELPASHIKPKGPVHWLVDKAAAG